MSQDEIIVDKVNFIKRIAENTIWFMKNTYKRME